MISLISSTTAQKCAVVEYDAKEIPQRIIYYDNVVRVVMASGKDFIKYVEGKPPHWFGLCDGNHGEVVIIKDTDGVEHWHIASSFVIDLISS